MTTPLELRFSGGSDLNAQVELSRCAAALHFEQILG